jgi:hypothetical protein
LPGREERVEREKKGKRKQVQGCQDPNIPFKGMKFHLIKVLPPL